MIPTSGSSPQPSTHPNRERKRAASVIPQNLAAGDGTYVDCPPEHCYPSPWAFNRCAPFHGQLDQSLLLGVFVLDDDLDPTVLLTPFWRIIGRHRTALTEPRHRHQVL